MLEFQIEAVETQIVGTDKYLSIYITIGERYCLQIASGLNLNVMSYYTNKQAQMIEMIS